MITTTTTGNELFRQGDVLIERLPSMPEIRTVAVEPVDGRHVLARGEKTGHHHSIPAEGAVMEVSDARNVFLRIMTPTAVVHQEHEPIPLAPGTYRVWMQRTYEPDREPQDVAAWE